MPDLLFLCHRIPYPPNKGEKIRAYQIAKHLARTYTLHLGCFIDDAEDRAHEANLSEIAATVGCIRVHPALQRLTALRGLLTGASLSVLAFGHRAMSDWVEKTVARVRPVAAFAYSSAMAQYLPPRASAGLPVVMDFVDVDSDKWRQYAATARWPLSWIYAREARTLFAHDRAVARRAAASLFVSRQEADLFKRLCPEAAGTVFTVGNGIDCDLFDPSLDLPSPYTSTGPRLVFTGTMDYRPNVDAVVWFARDILPLIQRVHPNTVFAVVGANPASDVTALAALPGLVVTGRVIDVRPFIAHADVVVAPLRLARGIQNKVLEGMAMAKPVVTTPQGLEGIDAVPGRDLLVAETPAALAQSVLACLDPDLRNRLADAARRLMVERYSWSGQLEALTEIVGNAAARS
jgi:sugar transferase (PEP-CTERM/EpsH1 system associated)